MLTKEIATKQIQTEAPSQWAEMTEAEREDAVRTRMNTIRRSEDRYLNAILPTPTTGDLEVDLQAANSRRLLAQEYAQAEVTEAIEANTPEGALEFWTWWTRANPGKEPLIDAWVKLWPTLVKEWLSRHPESEWHNPWHHQNQWTAFNWEEHTPEFSEENSADLIDLNGQIDSLKESITELAQAVLTNDLRWITSVGEGPSTQEGFSRTSLTWEHANKELRSPRYDSAKFPLDLLPQEATDEVWGTLISEWDMEGQDPWWAHFETTFPAWMATWLENHPSHWLNEDYDLKTRQLTTPGWQADLHAHKQWKAAQG